MDMIDYQEKSVRTLNFNLTNDEQLSNMCLGISGESGEVVDIIKKHLYQGHDLDYNKLIEELGDLMFYICNLCNILMINMEEDVLLGNYEKLLERYPDGFDSEKSVHRGEKSENDIVKPIGKIKIGDYVLLKSKEELENDNFSIRMYEGMVNMGGKLFKVDSIVGDYNDYYLLGIFHFTSDCFEKVFEKIDYSDLQTGDFVEIKNRKDINPHLYPCFGWVPQMNKYCGSIWEVGSKCVLHDGWLVKDSCGYHNSFGKDWIQSCYRLK